MIRFHYKFAGLIGCLLAGAVVTAEAPDLVPLIREDANKVRSGYQEIEAKAISFTRKGHDFFVKRQYKEAVDNYIEAIATYKLLEVEEVNPVIKSRIDSCREQIAKSYYHWAEKLALDADEAASVSQFAEAIRLCREAILIYPELKTQLEKKIARYEQMMKSASRKLEVEESRLIKDKDETDYNIQLFLRQAQLLAQTGQLLEARRKFEQVLLLNPYRIEAIQGLRAVNIRIEQAARVRRDKTTSMERITEVEWKWASPIRPDSIGEKDDININTVSKDLPDNKIQQKLRSIIIPRIDFEDVTIPTAIKYLREQSKQLDPEGEGINIFLRLAEAGTEGATVAPAAPVAPQPPLDDMGGGGGGEVQPANPGQISTPETTLNFVLSNKTLQESLYFLCRAANLRMRVEKYAVVIASHNIPLDDLETRIFPLEQAALSSIGGGDDPEQLKKYFMDRGIRFPEGAKIVFDPKISRLIATNTLENLREIEMRVTNELNHSDPMVQIQAKFVEMTQNDLKELGFNYALEMGQNDPSHNGRLEFTAATSMRNASAHGDDNILNFSRTFGNDNKFSMSVYALDQADNQNTISSPRVTTMNMRLATINMVEDVYYPSDYSDPEQTVTSPSGDANVSIRTYVGPSPTFTRYQLGVSLSIMPNVDIDQRTITMDVSPMLRDFAGWTSYTYTLERTEGLPPRVDVMKRPVFRERNIRTRVTVYDGETVILGGVIKDAFETVDDKIPILGEIPIIGRFFTSQYTKSEKVNLLVFLSCRLVKPDGSPFFADNPPKGLPTFPKEQ